VSDGGCTCGLVGCGEGDATHQGMVALFNLAKRGRLPTEFEAYNMLREEIDELTDALDSTSTLAAILKELADVIYVAYGYALARGWNLHEAFERVHESNMTKEPTESGKIAKGSGYVPPELMDLV
jgi:NTP pyrophosphatase (non-canonical NTP hydrolase)